MVMNATYVNTFQIRTVDKDGSIRWTLNGVLHREDGPAAEYAGGTKHWYLDGESIIVRNPDSPSFKKRWERLVGEYHIKRIMNE
jgi:hypothetical protein